MNVQIMSGSAEGRTDPTQARDHRQWILRKESCNPGAGVEPGPLTLMKDDDVK